MNKKGSIVTNLILAGIVMVLVALFLFTVVLPIFFPARVPPAVENQFNSLAELLNNMKTGDEDFFYYNMRDEYSLILLEPDSLPKDFFGKGNPIYDKKNDQSPAMVSKIVNRCNENICLCILNGELPKEVIDCKDIKGFEGFFGGDNFYLMDDDGKLIKLEIKKLGSVGRLYINKP
ncbi:hypothetical protein KY334_03775 [Candidatus Woesearchaeota archaeon]|nr:hypothetical protein [Candidatus Woesearchaeota archaeon]